MSGGIIPISGWVCDVSVNGVSVSKALVKSLTRHLYTAVVIPGLTSMAPLSVIFHDLIDDNMYRLAALRGNRNAMTF